MIKKIFLLMLCFVLCISIMPNISKAEMDLTKILPLLDITTGAALMSDELQDISSENNGLSNGFAKNFVGVAAKYLNNNDLLTNNKEFLNNTLFANFENVSNVSNEIKDQYIGFKFMAAKEMNETDSRLIGSIYVAKGPLHSLEPKDILHVNWIDRRVVIDIKKSEKSTYGYLISGVSMQGELLMEEELTKYFNETLVDYINTKVGFSLQYPSILGENSLQESEDGINIKNEELKIQLNVKSFSNTDAWTANKFYQTKMNDNNIVAKIVESKSSVSVHSMQDENTLKYELYIFTNDVVYEASFVYDKALSEDFGLYIQFLENTFTVLKGEIG